MAWEPLALLRRADPFATLCDLSSNPSRPRHVGPATPIITLLFIFTFSFSVASFSLAYKQSQASSRPYTKIFLQPWGLQLPGLSSPTQRAATRAVYTWGRQFLTLRSLRNPIY